MSVKPKNRYDRQKKLGAGAMGEVWLATDTLLNRPVAIKHLKTSDEARSREFFMSEAQLLASLNHPNITLIYDAVLDEERNLFYLIMEYVEGKSIEDLIAGWAGSLPLEIVLDIGTGILEALQYAHDKGIVHRDIKPANVMLQDEGIKLMDFGVAGLISLLGQGSDYVVGTPAYMAPEQILGEAIDGRADLYSLGILLYQLATGGSRPFDSQDTQAMFAAHLDVEPFPLSKFIPDAPLAFEQAIMRLLAKEPEDRYASAGAVLEVFRSIQARLKFSQAHLQLLDPEAKPVVGRADERSQLEQVWAETQTSARPRLLVVQGQAGIGKSRLIAEFLGSSVVDQGRIAVAGRCDESGIPYAPYADILATILDRRLTHSPITDNQLDQLLDHIPSLGRLLDLRRKEEPLAKAGSDRPRTKGGGLWAMLEDRVPENTPPDPSQTEWQFYATVLSILTELGPIAIFLKNANFLDEASAALTRFLIGQEQFAALVIAACRETDEGLPWLDDFSADEKVIIPLSPLSPAAIKGHVIHLIGGTVTDETAEVITERSQGNPLHAEEITRQLIESNELAQGDDGQWRYTPSVELTGSADTFLPTSVLKAFTRRIEQLSEPSREALAAAALIEAGPEFDFDLWLALLGGESQTDLAQSALEEALKKRLVRQIRDKRYAFRPADVARALVSTLPEPRQRVLHRQLAELLHPTQADPILVGHHYEQAGLATEAIQHLEQAGALAASANATHAALAYYNRAVSLIESPASYKMLGTLYRQNGEYLNSARAFKRALELAEQAGDIAEQARILNGLSFTLWLQDRYKKAYEYAGAVLKLADAPEAERAIAQSNLGMVSWLVGRLAEAEEWCQKAVDALQAKEDGPALAEAHYRLGQVYFSQGRLAEAQAAIEHAMTLSRNLEDEWAEAHCRNVLGNIAINQGDFEGAVAYLEAAHQQFEKLNNREGLMAVAANQGRLRLYQGHPEEALPLLSKALHLALQRGKPSAFILGDIYLLIARASLASGERDRAKAVADDALKLVKTAGNREYVARSQAVLARIYAAQADAPAAGTAYQEALALFEQVGCQTGLLRTRLSYARFLAGQGQSEQATALEKETRAAAANIGLFVD